MGSALSTFNDFMDTTGPSYLSGADQIVNEAVKNNYLLRRFMRGKGPSETVQGGSKIKDTIMFDDASTFQFYQPNDTFSWQNPQVLTDWEIDWRFSVDHMSWTDQEIELNTGGQGRNARHQTYKTLKRSKEQRLWTSLLNGCEDAIFATANPSTMEGATGTRPYSLPAFITENDTGGEPYLWGTPLLQNIDPTKAGAQPKWSNQVGTYTGGGQDANLYARIFSAFDEMWMDVQFIPPPSHQEYFENPQMNAMFIACSKKAQVLYVKALRASQDTFVTGSRQDPSYMKPQYAGVDVEYVSSLNTMAAYEPPSGTTAAVNETDADMSGARYYFVNANYLKFVYHTSRYMHSHPTMRHPNQPFTTVKPVDSWYNLICRSRQRQGIVSPSSDVTSY
tara:strand:+ start:3479 stop:4654 length:1176 start_codon:yes stop_codon:yes gene_type:complete